MKAKKILAILSALTIGASLCAFAACGNDDPDDQNPPGIEDPDDKDPDNKDPDNKDPDDQNPDDKDPVVVYGLPVAARGHYIKDADLVQDGDVRYLCYTTNETSGEDDNVIAVRKATYTEGEGKGWAYGDETIAISGTEGAWDEYIGSASIVKGVFNYEDEEYSWLIAYCATDATNDTQYQIGLAVAKTPDGEWTKVSETPLIEFDADVYGATSVGCYAPSLINLNKESQIRIFYTYADNIGHFARFVDVNAEDLSALATDDSLVSGVVYCPNDGDIVGGDAVPMFPNADFAYDAENNRVYAVKDVSPSAATNPQFADRIQLLYIAEDELYTVETGRGWVGVNTWDSFDTPDMAYERLYGATIVSDAYGHVTSGEAEIVYNVCELQAVNEDYLYTQNLTSFDITLD